MISCSQLVVYILALLSTLSQVYVMGASQSGRSLNSKKKVKEMKENRQHYEKKYDQVALAPKMGGILTNSKALALINRHPTKCNLCNRLPRAINPPLNRDPATGRISSSNNTRAEIVVAFCTMDLSDGQTSFRAKRTRDRG